MLRHRMFSRCAASSRAIPVQRFLEQVINDPYVPETFAANQPGMQAGTNFTDFDNAASKLAWLKARDASVTHVNTLLSLGVHKQWTNRLLEPFQWMTEVITATEWDNFFHLRIHHDAHPDIQHIARLMRMEMDGSTPEPLDYGEWHLPLVDPQDPDTFAAARDTFGPDAYPGDVIKVIRDISVGRVARVSYLRHEDTSDPNKDIERAHKMLSSGHLSPFEHVARPVTDADCHYVPRTPAPFIGNLKGWVQYRKMIGGEEDILAEARVRKDN